VSKSEKFANGEWTSSVGLFVRYESKVCNINYMCQCYCIFFFVRDEDAELE
jgi:hypothetical protein